MTWLQRKGNKFGAKSTTYDGMTYASKREAARAQELDLLVRGKAIKGWERQRKISIDICPAKKCLRLCSQKCAAHPKEKPEHVFNYYMDFVIHENDGTETWEEVKGFETDVWKMKWRFTEILFGADETIKLVVTK